MNRYLHNVLVAASQLVNALLGGSPLETYCASRYGQITGLAGFLNRHFRDHLQEAFLSSLRRARHFLEPPAKT